MLIGVGQPGSQVGRVGAGHALSKSGGVAVLALPTVSVAPTAAWFTRRAVADYTGPLYRLSRSTDSVTLDVQQLPDGLPDLSGLAAFAGAATIRWATMYDQTGGGNDLVQATKTLQPRFTLADAYRGFVGAGMIGGTEFFTIPAAITGSAHSTSSIGVGYAHATGDGAGYIQLGAAYGTDGSRALLLGITDDPRVQILNKAFLPNPRIAYAQPQVVGMVQSAANDVVHINNRPANITAGSAGTWVGGFIGKNNYGLIGTFFGHAIYPATLGAGDMAALKAALYTMYDIAPELPVQIVIPGNSIVQGAQSLRNTWNYVRQMEPLLSQRVEIINAGRTGQSAQTLYTNRARYAATFRADRRNIIVAPEPTNDIDIRTAANIVGFGTTCWNSYVLPWIEAMITAGFPLADNLVPTTLARSWTGDAALKSQKDTERAAYIALAKDWATANSGTILGFGDIPAMANPLGPNFADGIHPNSTNYLSGLEVSGNGYGYMAKLFADVVNARLAA